MNLYRELWSRIGGRPWTFILRDIWHKFEFFWIVGLIGVGIWLGHACDGIEILKLFGAFCAGYIGGHLFWGRDYIPNQRGK